MRRSNVLLFAVAVAVLVGCAPASGEKSEDSQTASGPSEAFLDSVLTTFLSSMRAKDATPFTAFYAEDAVSYAPNQDPLRGKAAIAENNKQWFASVEPDSIAAGRDGVLSAGDLAVETGWYYFKGKMFGQPGEDRGRYINVWQRQADGSWKIVRDMSNSSVPVPNPPAGADKK